MEFRPAIWVLVALLSTACTAPTAPTAVPVAGPNAGTATLVSDWTPVAAPCNEATVQFHDQMTGHAIVTNRSRCDHTYTLVVWEYVSATDQRAVAYHTVFVPAGGSAWLSLAFPEVCGMLYQRDVYMDLPALPPGHLYSLSDVANAVFWAPGVFSRGCDDGTASTPPGPPVDFTPSPPSNPPAPPNGTSNVCELAAFAQIDQMQVSGGQASIRLRLRDGYDNVVVYLMAYGSPTPFPIVGGRPSPTFPQSLEYQASFVIRAGPAQTISIAVPSNVVAYQMDAGCVPGPQTLLNRQTYPPEAFLEATTGNNP